MTPEQRHDCMASIHSEDTRPEQAVRRELWHRGYRFRKCVRTLPGTPERDLVNIQRLESIGWSAITVWECELGKSSIENTMEKIESMLEENRTKWEAYQAHRRESRKFAIEQARRRREVNAIIEAELKKRFSIPERIKRLSRIDEDLL